MKNARHDTTRCNILNVLAETASEEEWPDFNEQLKNIAEKNLAATTHSQTHTFYSKHLATAYINLGYFYSRAGRTREALDYYSRSLKMCEAIHYDAGIGSALYNIGSVYVDLGEHADALSCFERSLQARIKAGDKVGIAHSLNNIGLIYEDRGEDDKAIEYFNKSLGIREQIGDKNGIATSLNNLGSTYGKRGLVDEAVKHLNRAVELFKELGDEHSVAYSYSDLGYVYNRHGKSKEAEYYGKKAFEIARSLGYPVIVKRSAQLLSMVYEKQGNGTKALDMYKLFIHMRDSISNRENLKVALKKEAEYKYEKQKAEDSVATAKDMQVKNAQIDKQRAELTAKRNQQYFLFGGLCLVMVFAGFMYNRFKLTQKQKRIIEQQKQLVEAQKTIVENHQKELLDSIHYAKRIQTAFLPNEKYIQRKLMNGPG